MFFFCLSLIRFYGVMCVCICIYCWVFDSSQVVFFSLTNIWLSEMFLAFFPTSLFLYSCIRSIQCTFGQSHTTIYAFDLISWKVSFSNKLLVILELMRIINYLFYFLLQISRLFCKNLVKKVMVTNSIYTPVSNDLLMKQSLISTRIRASHPQRWQLINYYFDGLRDSKLIFFRKFYLKKKKSTWKYDHTLVYTCVSDDMAVSCL